MLTVSICHAGRGIAALSMSSSRNFDLDILSPSMILPNFPFLITLHLKIPYVRWSDLHNIKGLAHLESLHLCELAHFGASPEDWAFARKAQMTGHPSPFYYVSSLRSLQLELSPQGANWVHQDYGSVLQPISCMTKLNAFTLLTGRSLCNLQHLSQLSHLASLGVLSLEQGISTLVNLEHLSVRATQPLDQHQCVGANMSTEDLSPCLAMLTRLASLDCSSIHWQQFPNLTALTSLTALAVCVSNIVSNHSYVIWSSLSKLPLLVDLNIAGAVLVRTDFQTVALMTQLTKLHFCGYSDNMRFLAEDINTLSALASLQHLHLGFHSSGTWFDITCQIEHELKQLHNTRKMQYFKVFKREFQEYDNSDSDSGMYSDLDSDSSCYDSLSE